MDKYPNLNKEINFNQYNNNLLQQNNKRSDQYNESNGSRIKEVMHDGTIRNIVPR